MGVTQTCYPITREEQSPACYKGGKTNQSQEYWGGGITGMPQGKIQRNDNRKEKKLQCL